MSGDYIAAEIIKETISCQRNLIIKRKYLFGVGVDRPKRRPIRSAAGGESALSADPDGSVVIQGEEEGWQLVIADK
jgi:hypothetical protein